MSSGFPRYSAPVTNRQNRIDVSTKTGILNGNAAITYVSCHPPIADAVPQVTYRNIRFTNDFFT